MKWSSWALLISSAILYAIPAVVPYLAWWILFIFPIPLFYLATIEQLSFIHGFIWGSIALCVHLSGVLIGIDGYTGADDGIARLLPALGLIGYGALWSGCWFWITNFIQSKLKPKKAFTIITLWMLSLWCFVFFLDRIVLFPFDRIEGYFAFHPIIALATHPQFLMLMPIIGKNLLSLFLYAVPASITLFLKERTTLHALFILLACSPWIISLFIPIKTAQKPAWLDTTVAFPASFPRTENNIDVMELARKHFRRIEQDNTLRDLIILPESAFNCDHLSTEPELCKLWSEDHLGKPMHIIMGSFRWDGPYFRNSLHWIYNGKLISVFDKRHGMALLERIPSCINFEIFHQLFYKTRAQVVPSTAPRPRFEISDTIAFVPYICSELFFNEYPDDDFHTTPILATTNDLWCQNLYVAELMYLDARLKAIQWQRDILYISFKYAVYFDTHGNELFLARA